MCHPAQGGFDPAQDDRAGILVKAADEVGVSDHRAIGAAVVLAAGSVIIGAAFVFIGGVIGDHRIDAAAGDPPEQYRLAQAGDIGIGSGIRLGNDPHAESGAFQHPADHGGTDERAVDIAVTADQDDIQFIPTAGMHFFESGRQKARIHS